VTLARPLADGFAPYVWARTATEVAAATGLGVAEVLRFDANVPPLPGVPVVPLGESFAALNEYPEGTYRQLRQAAASYAGVDPEEIVVGAGADDLIGLVARTFLGPGRTAAVQVPTYPLYAIAAGIEGAEVIDAALDPDALAGVDVVWVCNPANPTGRLVEPEVIAALASALPDAVVAVDEAYFEYAGRTVVPFVREVPNLIALRSLSKAFGFAALRVGYAVAPAAVAAELDRRRAPAPVSAPAARIAAAALREPELDVESEVAERERMRDALLAAGFACPRSFANFVYVPVEDAPELADRLEAQGLVVRRYDDAIRITPRLPAENDRLLAALGAAAEPSAVRSALVVRTTAETALRVSLSLEGRRRSRTRTGVGFLDHLLAQLAFHGGLDLEVIAGGDLGVDEHHTVEDVMAAVGAALREALGGREGLTRYGAATVPMDEARATAVVDLVRRAHAEIHLEFTGDRVGGLALTLLPHALERFAIEAGCTVHVEAAGEDDHHVAEAAFKALGRALAEACAPATTPARQGSTKGAL
jgi:histidinol-phosphate aminotransferase